MKEGKELEDKTLEDMISEVMAKSNEEKLVNQVEEIQFDMDAPVPEIDEQTMLQDRMTKEEEELLQTLLKEAAHAEPSPAAAIDMDDFEQQLLNPSEFSPTEPAEEPVEEPVEEPAEEPVERILSSSFSDSEPEQELPPSEPAKSPSPTPLLKTPVQSPEVFFSASPVTPLSTSPLPLPEQPAYPPAPLSSYSMSPMDPPASMYNYGMMNSKAIHSTRIPEHLQSNLNPLFGSSSRLPRGLPLRRPPLRGPEAYPLRSPSMPLPPYEGEPRPPLPNTMTASNRLCMTLFLVPSSSPLPSASRPALLPWRYEGTPLPPSCWSRAGPDASLGGALDTPCTSLVFLFIPRRGTLLIDESNLLFRMLLLLCTEEYPWVVP